jgi:hypothetical protein
MGWLSSLNPVRAVRKVASELNPVLNANRALRAVQDTAKELNPVRTLNRTYRGVEDGLDEVYGALEDAAASPAGKRIFDDILGADPSMERGLWDPLGGKEAKDNARRETEEARALEEKRQADIRSGTQRVNDTFSQYSDSFYDSIAKAYEDYYSPQLGEQFNQAKRSLVLSSPSTGSSAFARRIGELTRDMQRQQVSLKERGQGAANSQRQSIENSRLSLIDSVNRGLGVDEAGNMASDRARLLSAPPVYDALPDLFSRFVAGGTNVVRAQQAGYTPDVPLLFSGRSNNTRTVG